MRNKLSLLIAAITASASVDAITTGDVSTRLNNLMHDAMATLLSLVQKPTIRQGLSLIFFFALLLMIYDSAVKQIRIFSSGSKKVSVPLALLSTIAVYRVVKPEVIESMFLWLGVGVLIAWMIKHIVRFANKLRGRPRMERRAVKDLRKGQKNQGKFDEDLSHDADNLFDEFGDEDDTESDEISSTRESISSIASARSLLEEAIKARKKADSGVSQEKAVKLSREFYQKLNEYIKSLNKAKEETRKCLESESKEKEELSDQRNEVNKSWQTLSQAKNEILTEENIGEFLKHDNEQLRILAQVLKDNMDNIDNLIGEMKHIDQVIGDALGKQQTKIEATSTLSSKIISAIDWIFGKISQNKNNIGNLQLLEQFKLPTEQIQHAIQQKARILNELIEARELKRQMMERFDHLNKKKEEYEQAIGKLDKNLMRIIKDKVKENRDLSF